MLWYRTRRKRRSSVTKHYTTHKELARAFIYARVDYWNNFYNFEINRIAIRNQRTCWGSCSEHKNLNFNYRLLFLPEHLSDYVVVHELCHLGELNHSKEFWALVEQTLPNYMETKKELHNVKVLSR